MSKPFKVTIKRDGALWDYAVDANNPTDARNIARQRGHHVANVAIYPVSEYALTRKLIAPLPEPATAPRQSRLDEARGSLARVEDAIDAILNVCDIVSEEHSRDYINRLNSAARDLGELVDRLENEEC